MKQLLGTLLLFPLLAVCGLRAEAQAVQPLESIQSQAELDKTITTLDAALFDVPAGYRPALPRWSGDFDITRPDTLANRFCLLWESASDLVHRFWR